MVILLVVIICGLMIGSMQFLFKREVSDFHVFSLGSFIALLYAYVTVLIGFGLIYTVFEMHDFAVLAGEYQAGQSYGVTLYNSLYFSAVTLFSVGYGDMYPIGVGKGIVIIESLVGYIMPALFVLRTVNRT
ncbi:two pore domain potassium channel family protein [Metabacillus iocasae]|uniref:Potassium channel LctB n=1 Tax=Priestia iocasae TaxID=2291674 RepID=A0ABS2QZ25_9BACI|nr:two pore domain potassium channel family protein [Metabacillus iocasae]MBM7704448.1 potassium channel LctB [Metabacillus iocasae]